jgi:hypothetical protein
LHTGSWLAKHGQSKPEKTSPFARVPQGPCAGQAIAFVKEDFLCCDKDGCLLDQLTLVSQSAPPGASPHVSFRYDKSATNHSIRKFTSMPDSFLCPSVTRLLSILQRAHALGVPDGYPIGAFRSDDSGAFQFLIGNDVQHVMQAACLGAYPDQPHCLRIHIKRLVSHSNRVTAAVALPAAGLFINNVAH